MSWPEEMCRNASLESPDVDHGGLLESRCHGVEQEVDEGDGFVVEDSEEERPKKQTKVKAKKRRAEEDDEDEVSASPVEVRPST